MRILFIHADYLEFQVKDRAIADAEPVHSTFEHIDEPLVCFITVESKDSPNLLRSAVSEIRNVAEKLHVSKLVLYPYAHLSSDLASPTLAKNILTLLDKELSQWYNVFRVPFGWYKAFTISCKGHPLSELSKTIKEEFTSEAVEVEEKIVSYWKILHQNKLIDLEKFDLSPYPNLKIFAEYETHGTRAVLQIPPHVKLMQQLELVGYEEGSDAGNFRYYPKGKMIKSLLEEYVTRKTHEYGAMEVETPLMYNFEHPALKSYLQRFPARQYTLLSGEDRYFLRFSACFGQFLLIKDSIMSYKHLPIRVYELAKYAFRREKRGELVGLRRLRAFTMPDMHTFTLNIEQAKQEFLKQFKLSMQILKDFGIENYEVAIRFTEEFWKHHREFVLELEKLVKKPILIQTWKEQFFYFILKFEFNFIDTMQKAAALSTVQIDVENAQRYQIMYYDETGEKKYPLILHCSPSGAIERVIYAILETQAMQSAQGKKPMLPLWLAPTQIRVIPVSERQYTFAEEIMNILNDHNIRTDLDDRDFTLAKKIRDAEKEWIPYIVVIGEKEKNGEILTVRVRSTGEIIEYKLQQLVQEIHKKTEAYPFRDIPVSKKLSMRLKFL